MRRSSLNKQLRRIEYPPGPSEIFPYRLALKFISNPLPILKEIVDRYGDISHFKFGFRLNIYLINNPYLIENILVKDNRYFVKSPGLQLAKRVIGNGLITNEGESHLIQRKIILPSFSRDKVKDYGEIITKQFIKYSNNNWEDGKVVDIHKEMTKITLSIISKILFGNNTITVTEIDKISDSITLIIEYINKLRLPFLRFMERLPIPSTLQYKEALEYMDNIIYSKIEEHILIEESFNKKKMGNENNNLNSIEENNVQNEQREKQDMLSILISSTDKNKWEESDTLLENKRGREFKMTKKQLRDEVMTIFLAGHETTANALTWTLYLLSMHPKVESKILNEISFTINEKNPKGENNINNNYIEFEDLPKLKYIEKVLMESMRLYPPSWAIGRQAITDYKLTDKYIIPSGSVIIISQYLMHHDSRFFSQVEDFIPERWTTEFRSSIPRFSYFPFGGGPRGCIGEHLAWTEGILILSNIINNWKIVLEEDPSNIHLQPRVTLRPKNGIQMKINKRNN